MVTLNRLPSVVLYTLLKGVVPKPNFGCFGKIFYVWFGGTSLMRMSNVTL